MNDYIILELDYTDVNLDVIESAELYLEEDCRIVIKPVDVPVYEGEYEFTPSQNEQIVEISDKLAKENIIINPIPNNYGLVTWNGGIITIS